MRILLINPPITSLGEIKIEPHPPLGLAYLASYLLKHRYSVKILDALFSGEKRKIGKKFRLGLTDKEIKKEIQEYGPGIIGISQMFTPYAQDSHRVARIAKKVNPQITTVLGGAHVSIEPQAVLKDQNVDIAVRGEGEITLLELVKALEKKKSLNQVTGITYRNRGIVQNPPTPFVKDLAELPFPAWHLLPLKLYDRPDDPSVMRHPLVSMITSRGCPGKCVFCSIHAVWGHAWRGRKARNVADEIELLIKKFGIREIHFQDDSMSLDKKRMKEICDEIIKRKLNFKWATPNGIAYWTLDTPLLKKMKRAGCYRITFGIESGDPKTRKWIGKPYRLSQVKKLTRKANQLGFWTIATYILGFPYETKKQIKKTINFAIKSDVDFALFYRLNPLPGTPVYQVFEKEKLLPQDKQKLYQEGVFCATQYLTKDELVALRSLAFKKFFLSRALSPLRFVKKTHSLEDLVYTLKLIVWGVILFFRIAIGQGQKITSKTIKGTF